VNFTTTHYTVVLWWPDMCSLVHRLLAGWESLGNFWGWNLLRIGEKYDTHGENFHRLLICGTEGCHAPNFCGEKFCK